MRTKANYLFGSVQVGGIDETCILRAKLLVMEIGHLDELEDCIRIQGYQSQGIEEQVDSLMDLVGNYDHHMHVAIKTAEALKQSTVYWCLADYENFASMPCWQKTVKNSPSVFKERNEKWIPKMQKAMKKTPVMFDFDTRHLIEDYGIIVFEQTLQVAPPGEEDHYYWMC